MKKWLTIPLALSLVLSLGACGEAPGSAPAAESAPASEAVTGAPAPEPAAPAPETSVPETAPMESLDETHADVPAQEPTTGPTIESVTYGANYVETTATDDDTVNSPSASSNVSAVTLSDGTEITAENGGVLTLVINGEQYDIPDYYHNHLTLPEGAFSFETTAGTDVYSEMGKFMNMAGQTAQYTYRSALKVNAEGIAAEETIPALLGGRSLANTFSIYLGQTQSYPYLTLSAPSFWSLIGNNYYDNFAQGAVLLALCLTVFAIVYFLIHASALQGRELLALGLIFSLMIPWLLPKMHERYFYLAEMLSLCYAALYPRRLHVPVILMTGGFLSYHLYLFGGTGILSLELVAAIYGLLLLYLVLELHLSLKDHIGTLSVPEGGNDYEKP